MQGLTHVIPALRLRQEEVRKFEAHLGDSEILSQTQKNDNYKEKKIRLESSAQNDWK